MLQKAPARHHFSLGGGANNTTRRTYAKGTGLTTSYLRTDTERTATTLPGNNDRLDFKPVRQAQEQLGRPVGGVRHVRQRSHAPFNLPRARVQGRQLGQRGFTDTLDTSCGWQETVNALKVVMTEGNDIAKKHGRVDADAVAIPGEAGPPPASHDDGEFVDRHGQASSLGGNIVCSFDTGTGVRDNVTGDLTGEGRCCRQSTERRRRCRSKDVRHKGIRHGDQQSCGEDPGGDPSTLHAAGVVCCWFAWYPFSRHGVVSLCEPCVRREANVMGDDG
jgi:hypothetical protein